MQIGDKVILVTEQYVGGNPLASMVEDENKRLVMRTAPAETVAIVTLIRENDYTVEMDDGQYWIISNDGELITRGYA